MFRRFKVIVGGQGLGALGLTTLLLLGCSDNGTGDDQGNQNNNSPGRDAAVDPDGAQTPDGSVSPDGEVDPPDGSTQTPTGEPLFDSAATYETTVPGSNDPATVYYPNPADLAPGSYSFPIALLLQGADVERGYYAGFATLVARYGFVVVVPDHETTGIMGTALNSETKQTIEVLDHMIAENQGAGPVAGVLDTDILVLLGHSYGGVVGLQAIQNQCQYPFCSGGYTRPEALVGGAFYGTNLKPPFGSIPEVDNEGIPIALVQGTLDSKATMNDTQTTYDNIQDPPKLLVKLEGANHYGNCDQNNPPGAQADSNTPTLSQTVSVETSARFSALFLRATVLGDTNAAAYIATAGSADPNVTVTWQP